MLINLSIILSNSPIMLTDFTYYSQNYAYFKIHDSKNEYKMLFMKWSPNLNTQQKVIYSFICNQKHKK